MRLLTTLEMGAPAPYFLAESVNVELGRRHIVAINLESVNLGEGQRCSECNCNSKARISIVEGTASDAGADLLLSLIHIFRSLRHQAPVPRGQHFSEHVAIAAPELT